MKEIIGLIIEIAAVVFFGTVGFNQMYHETKMAALSGVSKGTVSLTKLSEKLTGTKSMLDRPTNKNYLQGIGRWDK